jgi:hypothetical protein
MRLKIMIASVVIFLATFTAHAQEPAQIVFENDSMKWVLGADAKTVSIIDKQSGADYAAKQALHAFASALVGDKSVDASSALFADGVLSLGFGDCGIAAKIEVRIEKTCFVFTVKSVTGDGLKKLEFARALLTLKGSLDEPFSVCSLALNLKTNVPENPGPNPLLHATCVVRFGFEGASVAVVGAPSDRFRDALKEAVLNAPELPRSNIGGPFAMDADISHGSYLFDLEGISEENVDSWVELAKRLGLTQIDFNTSFRYGDFQPRPDRYPRGRESVKAVTDKLHAAGISAGLHTYAFFINKDSKYVTPTPDPRLGKSATFTLSEPFSIDSIEARVEETTANVSTATGFFIRNGVTIQIDDELITFAGVNAASPFGFTGCVRGACKTTPAAHEKGAKVYLLKECFGLFTPDPDSTLFTEIAANTADTFNECGFDMIYEDALDGEDILAGAENSWHYGSKFVFEIANRLKKPALFEMSTFHHHLWYVRARMGAWDHPCRAHKKFVDLHCAGNDSCKGLFLPMNLGWWAVQVWNEGPSETCSEPTFNDDIEYLMCKCVGWDMSISLMGVTPSNIGKTPAFEQLAPIFKQYEDLRLSKRVSDSVKSRLRVPGDEFTLETNASGAQSFRPIKANKHRVQSGESWTELWNVKNNFAEQPLRVRIEGLMAASSYDSPDSVVLEDFSKPETMTDRASAEGVSSNLEVSTAQLKSGAQSGRFTAANAKDVPSNTWTRVGAMHTPPLNAAGQKGVGVWVYGDGKGELLNIQERSPLGRAISGVGDHYITIDFTGWRYCALVEIEAERVSDYSWPYGSDGYGIYREFVDYGQIESFSIWFNNLPPKDSAECYLSPVKALPLAQSSVKNPSITIGGKKITFPISIDTGCYLEFSGMDNCRLYGKNGILCAEVKPQGEMPVLTEGDNSISFACDSVGGYNPRANVVITTQGSPFGLDGAPLN